MELYEIWLVAKLVLRNIICRLKQIQYNEKARSMVDLISLRLHDAYMKWETHPKPVSENRQRLTPNGLRRYNHIKQKSIKKQQERSILKEIQARALLKDERWENPFPPPKTRPFIGLCCSTCAPSSQTALGSKVSRCLSIQNMLLVDAQGVKNGFLTRRLCHLATVWKLKKHDYPQCSGLVLRDERLKNAIETATTEDYKEIKDNEGEEGEGQYEDILKYHKERARKILEDMHSTLSDLLLRLTSWVLYKLLPCFLTSVAVHPAQIEMLKKAGESGIPLIFMPLHRSHLDYILCSFILLNNNIKSPLVAAGNNLKIPVFGGLLRGLGAFFIKRRMDPVQGRKDVVYRAVLQTYMVECLRAGHNMEFFIEGGRTRTGKTCMPKGGLLSVIIDAYKEKAIDDALLVPVSVNYEKLVDGNFIREQRGQPKQMETFVSAVKGIWNTLTSNYGMMRMDFNQPFSLKELCDSFHTGRGRAMPVLEGYETDCYDASLTTKKQLHSLPSSSSLYGTDIISEDDRLLVESIARHVVYDCTKAQAVMSTNAVAFLLLNRFRQGVTMDRLVSALDSLRQELEWANKDVGFTGESLDVINHAIDLLGLGLVKKECSVVGDEKVLTITPVTMLPNVIELTYYSNALLPHFAVDSIVVTALFAILTEIINNEPLISTTKYLSVYHERLVEYSLELFDVFQFEFIFAKPCQHLVSLVGDVIDSLKSREVISQLNADVVMEEQKWSRGFSRTLNNQYGSSDEDEMYYRSLQYVVNRTTESLEHLEFLHSLLRPLVDTYIVAALSLSRLVDRVIPEKQFEQEILQEIENQLNNECIHYGESACVDPIRNALKLFQRWEVLECRTECNIKVCNLHEAFNSDREVGRVFDKLSRFKWPISSQ